MKQACDKANLNIKDAESMSFIEEDLLSLDSTPFCFSKWRLVGPWLWNWWVNGAISNVQQLVVSWLMLVGYSAYPWHIFQIPQSSKGGSWQHEAPVRYFSMCLACLHHHVTYLPYPNIHVTSIYSIYIYKTYKQHIENRFMHHLHYKMILRMEQKWPQLPNASEPSVQRPERS